MKVIRCDCGFEALGDGDEDLINAAQSHARETHDMDLPAELLLALARLHAPNPVRDPITPTGEPLTLYAPGSMLRLVARRVAFSLAIRMIASVALFVFVRVTTDPLTLVRGGGAATADEVPVADKRSLEAERHRLGLDRPLASQYFRWSRSSSAVTGAKARFPVDQWPRRRAPVSGTRPSS